MNFDILILNGKMIDGAGNPWVRADLGIKNGKIAEIGQLTGASAATELDATNLVVCPGFIDPHTHSDRSIPLDPKTQSTLHQGVTTQVIGMCGSSLAPINPDKMEEFKKSAFRSFPAGIEFPITWHTFAEYLAAMDKLGCASNAVPVVGFGNIRIAGGPGYEDRPPTPAELDQMKQLVDEAMQAGAFGMSTGLIYTPQIYAQTDEIIEMAKVVTKYGGIYFSHIRSEGETVVEAVKEVINIVAKSGCTSGQIAHHKIFGKTNWGKGKATLQLMEEANTQGLNITCDQYPYTRGMTSLITVLPPWVHVGGVGKILERLQNPEDLERIKKDINAGSKGWDNFIVDCGWDRIFIATLKTDKWKDMIGKSLTEITQLKGYPDEFATLFEILLDEKADVSITDEFGDAEELKYIMRGRYTMVGSDGWSVAPTGMLNFGKPHPRLYGTYPRVLGKFVREEGVLALEDAIRKMTSFPAQKVGLFDRGLLRKGMWADVVVFDPQTIIDQATYENPHQFAVGIRHVMVNGELVIENEKQTNKLPGFFLRRPT